MIILSIDGGASRTRGVLFTERGEVRLLRETEATSLSTPGVDTTKILGHFIQELAAQAGLGLEAVDLVNIGVAGVSNPDARDRLFLELDRLDLSDRALVTSDVEAAYEAVWGAAPGVLVCVGTGAIGWARDEQGNTYRASGRGPQLGGDPGSGYWMGKTALVHLIMSEGSSAADEQAQDAQLDALRRRTMAVYGAESIDEAARIAGEAENMVARTALLGQVICELAAEGNDLALAIVQEGTQALADELLIMIDKAELRKDKMTIGINGSIITRNPVFRKMLADALSYDLPDITWRLPEIDPAFGAGLIAARINKITVDREALKKSWRENHLHSAS
ncbi:MAG: N-acetylglucosamine kinase [Candidatus Neomarinimicrobiota bacterium]